MTPLDRPSGESYDPCTTIVKGGHSARGCSLVDERGWSFRRVGHARPVDRAERRDGLPGPGWSPPGAGVDRGRPRPPGPAGPDLRRARPEARAGRTAARRPVAVGAEDARRLSGGGRGGAPLGPALEGPRRDGGDRPRLCGRPPGPGPGHALSPDRRRPGLRPDAALHLPGRPSVRLGVRDVPDLADPVPGLAGPAGRVADLLDADPAGDRRAPRPALGPVGPLGDPRLGAFRCDPRPTPAGRVDGESLPLGQLRRPPGTPDRAPRPALRGRPPRGRRVGRPGISAFDPGFRGGDPSGRRGGGRRPSDDEGIPPPARLDADRGPSSGGPRRGAPASGRLLSPQGREPGRDSSGPPCPPS